MPFLQMGKKNVDFIYIISNKVHLYINKLRSDYCVSILYSCPLNTLIADDDNIFLLISLSEVLLICRCSTLQRNRFIDIN